MARFWVDIQQFQFLQFAFLVGLLSSIACGVMGSFVITRRISYLAGAIAHSVLAGLGAAKYLQVVHHIPIHPLVGAVIAALISALMIGLVRIKLKQREDTVIGAIWAIGMAIGLLFIYQTPGYNEHLFSYLFGNILMVSETELVLVGGLDILLLVLLAIAYPKLVAVCFDEEFAAVRGIPVTAYYLLILCFTALTVVLMVTVVGIVMVIALLTLPTATANTFTNNFGRLIVVSVLINATVVTGGLMISYEPNLPPGAVTILFAGVLYLATLFWQMLSKWHK